MGQKKAGNAILLFNKTEFKAKFIRRDNEGNNKENTTVLNINTENSDTVHLIKSNYRLQDTNETPAQ